MRRAGGGSRSAAVCGTRPRRGASRASQEASAGPGGPRVVPPGTGGGGREVLHPPLISHVGVRRRCRLVVRVEWLPRVGAGLAGPFGVDVVAGRIRFLVWGGRPLVGGGVVGWSARWVVLPSHALVLLVHGGLRPDGVG